ncbi:dihydropteroate synthase [Actinomycetes bacterium]|nr:dihydropteroate synthase [Actinomycetes bacterium]
MLVMGILNLTPDSFADGGRHNSFDAGVARGLEMVAEGVDIIDIGGESTRPGADRVSAEEEQARVLPVITELAKHGVRISIDTMRADTAEKAVHAGAAIINDVSGGLSDPAMFATVKKLGVPYILMHWRGESKDMNSRAIYTDVVNDVISEINSQVDAALDAGINKSQIIIDPGLGFAKDAEHNWEILRNLKAFTSMGYPVLIGASRKRFLGGDNPDEREAATIELTKTLVPQGIWGVRVHSVKPHVDVIAGAK